MRHFSPYVFAPDLVFANSDDLRLQALVAGLVALKQEAMNLWMLRK